MKTTITGALWGFVHDGRICEGLQFSEHKMVPPFFKVMDHTIEVDVPDDFDPRPIAAAALKEEREKVRGEMSARILELDKQINSLLCIEMVTA